MRSSKSSKWNDLPDYVVRPWEWEEYKLAGNEIPSSHAFDSFGILERFMPYENYMISKNTTLFNALLEEAKQRRTNEKKLDRKSC